MQHFFGIVGWKSKYDIVFKGLAEGLHDFEFQIDDSFFEHFDGSLVERGEANIEVKLEKRSAFLKLQFVINGRVELLCDRCLDNYMQKVKHKTELFVKFGETESEEGESVIWILPDEYRLNLAQLIYEFTMLSIPLRHIHPKSKDGERGCNKEMLDKLKNYMQNDKDEKPSVDPRWEALNNLKNKN